MNAYIAFILSQSGWVLFLYAFPVFSKPLEVKFEDAVAFIYRKRQYL